MRRYLIDSYAMMAFFEDEPGADLVAEILAGLVDSKIKGFMSIINWGEIYYNTYRVQGKDAAEAILSQLRLYPFELVDADRSLTYEAAKLKGKYRIAYADCFAAALANRLDAAVLTGDRESRKLEETISVKWIV